MFNTASDMVDRLWGNRLAAYADRFDNADLSGEEVTLPAHVDLELPGGVIVGGYDCDVDMEHDGDDWAFTGITYRSDLGGASDDFDTEHLRQRAPDGSLCDLMRREILHLVDVQYNRLADEATLKARAA